MGAEGSVCTEARLTCPFNTCQSANQSTKPLLQFANAPQIHPLVSTSISKHSARQITIFSHAAHLPAPPHQSWGSHKRFSTQTARVIHSKCETDHFPSLLKPLSGVLTSPPCPLHSNTGRRPDSPCPAFTPVVTLQAQSLSVCLQEAFPQPYGTPGLLLHSLKRPTCFCSICSICSSIMDPVISYLMNMSPASWKPGDYIILITAAP